MLLLHPGGVSLPPIWLYSVIALAALAGLLQLTRPGPARLGWLLAIDALVGGLIVAGVQAHVPGGSDTFAGWPGIATAMVGAGLLTSAAVAGTRLRARLTQSDFGWRQPLALLLATAAAARLPLVAGGFWIAIGTGHVLRTRVRSRSCRPSSPPSPIAHGQARTVVLKPGPAGQVDYTVLRDRNQQLGDADLPSDPGQVRGRQRRSG